MIKKYFVNLIYGCDLKEKQQQERDCGSSKTLRTEEKEIFLIGVLRKDEGEIRRWFKLSKEAQG